MIKFLDPRFALVAGIAADLSEAAEMREACRSAAAEIATQCGFALDEALAKVGLGDTTVALDIEPDADAHLSTPQGDGPITLALVADPNRSDRDIARELQCSPTSVGKIRLAMGLRDTPRSVQRGGQIYDMVRGNRQ